MTAGATEAVAAAMLAMVDTGDEVIALEPYYDSYAASIAMAGGVRVPVTLRAPDFRLDVAALRGAVTSRTQAHLAEHAAQPDRHGADPRRVAGGRRRRDRTRPDRRDRRGLRAPGLRRRARADLDAAGHVGADADDLVGGQDVCADRLEDRLGDRAGRLGCRRPHDQAVPDVCQCRAVAAGDRGRARARRLVLRDACR